MTEMGKNQGVADRSTLYPQAWTRKSRMANGVAIVVRPILPDDEILYKKFMQKNTAEDIRHRFFETLRELPAELVVQLTHVDYLSTMAFVALGEESGDLLGVARFVAEPSGDRAEYSVMTRSDLKGEGIGFALMTALIEYAKSKKIQELWGQVTRDNIQMVQMCRELGFEITPDKTDLCCVVATLVFSKQDGGNENGPIL